MRVCPRAAKPELRVFVAELDRPGAREVAEGRRGWSLSLALGEGPELRVCKCTVSAGPCEGRYATRPSCEFEACGHDDRVGSDPRRRRRNR